MTQVHVLEESAEIELTLVRPEDEDGTWCETVKVPELFLEDDDDGDGGGGDDKDHLVIAIDQTKRGGRDTGAHASVYYGCRLKGQVRVPESLRRMIDRVKNSKVKLYRGDDIELTVSSLTS